MYYGYRSCRFLNYRLDATKVNLSPLKPNSDQIEGETE